jgi:hypothetical protein
MIWYALPFVGGIPVYILTHSGDSELHALGHRLGDILAPLYYLWEMPMKLGYFWAEGLGLTDRATDALATLIMFALHMLAGALSGLLIWTLSVWRHRRTTQAGAGAGLSNDRD